MLPRSLPYTLQELLPFNVATRCHWVVLSSDASEEGISVWEAWLMGSAGGRFPTCATSQKDWRCCCALSKGFKETNLKGQKFIL